MISIDQWRCAIGSFQQPMSGKSPDKSPCVTTEDYDMCARLLVVAAVLWGAYLENTAIDALRTHIINTDIQLHMVTMINASVHITSVQYTSYHQPYVDTIALAMDVETNPGPEYQNILEEIREFRKEHDKNFQCIMNDLSMVRKEIIQVKEDIDKCNEKIAKQSSYIDTIYDECYGDMQSMKQKIARMEAQIESQERYSRRENIILHGIPQESNETSEKTKEKVIEILNRNVSHKSWTKNDFVRVHRLKTKSQANQPVIVRLYKPDDKFDILRERKKLKDDGYGVANDLTLKQRQELNQLTLEGKRGYFRNGKLHIEDQSGNPERRPTQFRFGEGGFPYRGHSNRYARGAYEARGRSGGRGSTGYPQSFGNAHNGTDSRRHSGQSSQNNADSGGNSSTQMNSNASSSSDNK